MVEIIVKTESLFKKTAAIIAQSIDQVLIDKDEVIIGLPGGRSIENILKCLIREKIQWNKVHIFMIDERLVPIDNLESNFRLIKKGLSDVVPISNLHPFCYKEDLSDKGLTEYIEEIMKYGAKYDIILVSSGEDGHIGALYPDHSSILDESNFLISMNDSPKPPKNRMSISKNFLLRSTIGIILFAGDIKKQAYEMYQDKNIEFRKCPAKLVNLLPKSYVITDIE